MNMHDAPCGTSRVAAGTDGVNGVGYQVIGQERTTGGAREALGKRAGTPRPRQETKGSVELGSGRESSRGEGRTATVSNDFLIPLCVLLTWFSMTARWLGFGRCGRDGSGTRMPAQSRQNAAASQTM